MKGFLGFLLLCVATAASAQQTTYQIISANYAPGDILGPLYNPGMRIEGNFTVSVPLPANMAVTEIGPQGLNLVTAWSFSDGVNTFTEANSRSAPGIMGQFAVATNSAGELSFLGIGLSSPLPPISVNDPIDGLFFDMDFSSGIRGVGRAFSGTPCADVDPIDQRCTVMSPLADANSSAGTGPAPAPFSFSVSRQAPDARSVPVLTGGATAVLAAFIALFGMSRFGFWRR